MNTDVSLSSFAQEAYKDYALYVLHDRALPSLIDGLKPVQRRLVYTMSLLHLDYQSKPKKSVRTVGDALGKFHPHSDQACYEALVHLSQPFTTRYPLLHGQGNFGSQDDPKSFAAMRYTEVKLSMYAPLLLENLNEEVVPWQTNFDGTLQEPQVLPAQLPFLLLNGCSGIAVGMSCEIPPFNLAEVIDALLLLLSVPKSSVEDLIDVLPAPDFPAGGVIKATLAELKALYSTNTSSFTIEGLYTLEDKTLFIEQLPYGLSTSRLIEQIQQLVQKKELTGLTDLQDLSDHTQPVGLKCVFKTENDALKGLKVLLQKTDLRKTYRVYFNILNEQGIPSGMSVHDFLRTWIELRKSMMLKQYKRQMRLIELRLHIINALGCLYEDIEKVIQIIRFQDNPWELIATRYDLDQEQIEALKKLRLSQMTKLNAEDLALEKEKLEQEKVVLYGLIHSPTKLKNALKKDLNALKKAYGDKRRTKILSAEKEQVSALYHFKEKVEPIKSIPLKVMITQMGWIKAFKADALEDIDTEKSLRSGDLVVSVLSCISTSQLALWDNCGRVYAAQAHKIATSRFGEHVGSLISLPSGHQVMFATTLHPVLVLTANFLSMRVPLQDLGLSSRGMKVVNLGPEDQITHVHLIDSPYVLVQTDQTMGVILLDDIALQKKGKGVLLVDRKSNAIEKIEDFRDTYSVFLKKTRGKPLEKSFEDLLIKRGGKLKKIPATHLGALREIKDKKLL